MHFHVFDIAFFFCERCVWHCFMQSLMFFDSFHLSWFVLYFRFCRYNLIDIGSGFLWFFTFICLTLLVGAPNFSTVLGMLHSGGYIKDHNGPSNWHYLGHGPLLLAHTLLGIHGTAMEQWCTVPRYIILYSWPGGFNPYAQTKSTLLGTGVLNDDTAPFPIQWAIATKLKTALSNACCLCFLFKYNGLWKVII